MKFTLSTPGSSQSFSAYGDGWVEINGARHTHSLILTPDSAPRSWVREFSLLSAADFSSLLDWRPELVVFGSGRSFRFPHPSLTRALVDARVGLEVMDTHAACRTFAVLAGEGRRVLAAILID
jgi:uncharacterized protein